MSNSMYGVVLTEEEAEQIEMFLRFPSLQFGDVAELLKTVLSRSREISRRNPHVEMFDLTQLLKSQQVKESFYPALTESQFRSHLRSGHISPVVKVGKRLYFTRDSVEKLKRLHMDKAKEVSFTFDREKIEEATNG